MLFNFLNKKIIDVQAEDEIAMGCCCQPCPEPGPGDCRDNVSFTITTVVRGIVPEDGIVNIFIEDTSCLQCIKDKCSVDVEVPNPCPGEPRRIPCTACLNRYRYVGCVKYSANFSVNPAGTFFTCFRDCLCIDSVRCYDCEDCTINRCPTDPNGFITGYSAEILGSSVIPGTDFSRVRFRITLTLSRPCAIPVP